ncbi:MAG: tyrosine-type recombinase/integrase [Acidobacteriota bacterium]
MVKRPPATKGRPNPLTEAEEAALLQHLPKWARPLITWAINSGMDRAEVLGLTWDQVDRKEGMVYATRSKTGVERQIPLDGPLGRIVADRARFQRLDTRRVFLGHDGQPVTFEALKSAMRRAWHKACPDKTRPWKSLRATFATRLASQGTPVPVIARLMGLSTTHVLDFYCKPFEAELRAAMAGLGNVRTQIRTHSKSAGEMQAGESS